MTFMLQLLNLLSEFRNTLYISGSSSPESKIKIGDKVYVKPSVITPRYQWGSVTNKSIGVVKGNSTDCLHLITNFRHKIQDIVIFTKINEMKDFV